MAKILSDNISNIVIYKAETNEEIARIEADGAFTSDYDIGVQYVIKLTPRVKNQCENCFYKKAVEQVK